MRKITKAERNALAMLLAIKPEDVTPENVESLRARVAAQISR